MRVRRRRSEARSEARVWVDGWVSGAGAYGRDGTLTADGCWNYTWDAENRLIRVESRSATPQASWRRVEWTFDAFGRRIRQRTWVWTNNTWQVAEDLKLVSDPLLFGRHIVELNTTNNALVRSHVWGLDLSETMDGAGGVGGLLWVTLHTASGSAAGTHFCAYDGNGNVVALASASGGSATARYEYGPFGEPIRVSGPAASMNPFRFSTKRTCNTTDLVLYEYRAYSPALGCWLSRDPIGELGGDNLYTFVRNDSVLGQDFLGLVSPVAISITYAGHGSAEKNGTSKQYVEVDSDIKGQVPLDVRDSKPAASVWMALDTGFNARIFAWTELRNDSTLTSLQMSTDLHGEIEVRCPACSKRVRASWSASAALFGTGGGAHVQFDSEKQVLATPKRPIDLKCGAKEKTVDSSYRAQFTFVMGQAWIDVSKTTGTTSLVRLHASFECF